MPATGGPVVDRTLRSVGISSELIAGGGKRRSWKAPKDGQGSVGLVELSSRELAETIIGGASDVSPKVESLLACER